MNFTSLSFFLLLISSTLSLRIKTNPTTLDTTSPNDTISEVNTSTSDDTTTNSTNSTTKVPASPITIKNCYSYAVNSGYTEYGCIECSPNHTLISSPSGTGICKASISISYCKNQFQFGNDTAHSTCLECSSGFSRSPNATTCSKITIDDSNEIQNCRSYAIDPFGEVSCNRCESGFTLSNDYKSCDTKCNIENCDSCFMINKSQYCLFCQKNFIGIYGGDYNSISECISYNDWIKNLLSQTVIEQFDN